MREEIIALVKRSALVAAEMPAPTSEVKTAVPAPVEQPEQILSVPREAATESPRTGVEIVDSQERKGQVFHSMRDLRDGDVVHNVTRASARRLWRYAIALQEKHTFNENNVTWYGNLGLWHKYLRNGKAQYDLVQRSSNGAVHIYYGVTEDGVFGPWKQLIDKEAVPSIAPPEE